MYTEKQRLLTGEQLTALAVAAVIGIGLAGIAAAHRDEAEMVQPSALRDIVENLDGKEATVVEMTLEPGPVERHVGLRTPDPR